MAQPLIGDIHIDTALTEFSVQYRNDALYIADRLFPRVPVAKETGKYFIFDIAEWFRNEKPGLRDLQALPDEVEYTISTGTYACQERAFQKAIPDPIRRNTDQPLDPDRNATQRVTEALLMALEKDVAGDVFSTTTFSGFTAALSGTDQWDNAASNPRAKVMDAHENVIKQAGAKANVAVMGRQVYTKLLQHPDFVDNVKYTSLPGMAPISDAIANVFGVDTVLVGDAIENTADEGQTASFSFVWGKFFLLAYVNPAPALESPSLGYTMAFQDRVVERFRDDRRYTDYIVARESWDEKVVSARSGYLYSTVVP